MKTVYLVMFVTVISGSGLHGQSTAVSYRSDQGSQPVQTAGMLTHNFDSQPQVRFKVSDVTPNPAGDNASFVISAQKSCELEVKMRDPDNLTVMHKKIQVDKGLTTVPLKLFSYKAGRYSLAVRYKKHMSIQYIDIVK